MKRVLALSLAAMAIGVAVYAQTASKRTEQRGFSLGMDGPVVLHPVKLSDEELAALANDSFMKEELDQDPPIPKLTREGLEVGVVHLGDAHERDLVVVGSGPQFMGANIGPYWIIRDLPSGPVVVFHGATLALRIRKAHTNGLNDIEVSGYTAAEGTTTILHFDGEEYKTFKQRSFPIGK